MREIRPSGSEGGGALIPFSLPLSVRLRAHLAGEVKVLSRCIQRRSETPRNCVVARRGGEQREKAKGERPVRRITNSIRLTRTVSLQVMSEARRGETRACPDRCAKTCEGGPGTRRWLETEWSEGRVGESGRPVHGGAERAVAGKTPEHCREGGGRSQSAHSSEEGP